jgi:hypothetical protein
MSGHIVIMYVFMLAFDLAVLGGTTWLIVEHQWSKWWLAFAALLCTGVSISSHGNPSKG